MMVSPIIVAIFVALFLYQIYKFCFYRPEGFPPGPPRLPVFGSYILLLLINHKNLHYAIEKLCKFYKSSVIGFYTADSLTVIANDQKSIREMFFNPDLDGRNDFFIGRLREPNYKVKGIFFTDGSYWSDQRRFALRHLRDFGFGRRHEDYETEVRHEMMNLIAMIKDGPRYEHEKEFLKRGEILLPKALIGCLGNCFLQVLSGERFSRAEQAQLFQAGYGSMDFQIYSNEYGKLISIIPWIRFFFPKLSSFSQLRDASMEMCNLMKRIIDRQMISYQEGHVRNFIDLYIEKMKNAKANDLKTGYLYDQLLMVCTDFLFPSLSAIETTIAFLFKHLLYRRDILKKVQDEIDSVVGSGRLPGLDDRVNMPYTEATLREIMRFETLVPSSVPHRALRDTMLAGFEIPKDTVVMAGLIALHNDKAVWKDPENFRPERLLDNDGKLNLKQDASLPFGAGRRLCAGETFARNTMFLCIAALLQNFNLKPAGSSLPSLNDNDCGLARMPRDFWIKLEAR